MTAIVPGVYKQGHVELLESPSGLREGRVRVVLIEEGEAKAPPRHLTYGKYRTRVLSRLEDFASAEWHGGQVFGDRHGQ
jgi:hypothetical protein